jgi:putative endonuclease
MKNDDCWEVYIIRTTCGKLYTGITNNMLRRFSEHSTHQKGARFFHFADAKEIVFREVAKNRSVASKRESEIKKLTRSQKIELIKNNEMKTYTS